MVSRMPFLQWGHSADSARLIRWRIVLRGMCPVLSCHNFLVARVVRMEHTMSSLAPRYLRPIQT